jgi:hypothetical protein
MSFIRTAGVLATVILACFLAAKVFAAPSTNGWIMKQTSDEYGILETSCTSKALRLDTPELTILLLPPKYPLYIYNRKNKRFIEEPTEDFVVHTKPNAIKPHMLLKQQSDVTLCGVKANRYLCFDDRVKTDKPRFEFSATRNLNVPAKLADACMIFFSIPEMTPGHGLPLSAIRLSQSGAKFAFVTTRAIERVYIPPETFAKPKNFTKVSNFLALSSNSEIIPTPSADALDYMMDDKKK